MNALHVNEIVSNNEYRTKQIIFFMFFVETVEATQYFNECVLITASTIDFFFFLVAKCHVEATVNMFSLLFLFSGLFFYGC